MAVDTYTPRLKDRYEELRERCATQIDSKILLKRGHQLHRTDRVNQPV